MFERTGKSVDDYGDDYGLRSAFGTTADKTAGQGREYSKSSTVVVAVVVVRSFNTEKPELVQRQD